jgi:hypothetical protein
LAQPVAQVSDVEALALAQHDAFDVAQILRPPGNRLVNDE